MAKLAKIHPYVQRHGNDCSPTAILNAINWASEWFFTKTQLNNIRPAVWKKCRINKDGTDDRDFIKALTQSGQLYGYEVMCVERVAASTARQQVQKIYGHLSRDGSVVLSHLDLMDKMWHHSFWFDISAAKYLVGINVIAGMAWYACPKSCLVDILKMSCVDEIDWPEIYYLRKV